jgi:transcriptional regulator with XRE-family HTH domain
MSTTIIQENHPVIQEKIYDIVIMSFGAWLKAKRAEKRMSGVDLERRSGVSRQYISNLEREHKSDLTGKIVQPTVEKVDALAKGLGVSESEARIAAGYAPANENFHKQVPDFIYQIDWQKFSPTALNEIKSFIEFKATYEALPLIKNGEVLQEDGELFVEFSEEEVLQLLVEEEKLHHKN